MASRHPPRTLFQVAGTVHTVSMEIAGGLYRELCEVPAWDEILGSGGRAALSATLLDTSVRLHTYAGSRGWNIPPEFAAKEVKVVAHAAPDRFAFAYFHPLSRPHVQPGREGIAKVPPMHVVGRTVLRFGLLEGDAVVNAARAVFDPQTSDVPLSFHANGSQADELALVLNEVELRAFGGGGDLMQTSMDVMAREAAGVVVVKRGLHGAEVFTADGKAVHVPAYRSGSVFKIGTGDVFSAAFAFHWGEAGLPPHVAADRASRAVASYAKTRCLPPPRDEHARRVDVPAGWRVLLLGEPGTLGRRWMLEESRHLLRELGLEVSCPGLDGASPPSFAISLLLTETLSSTEVEAVIAEPPGRRPLIVFTETASAADVCLPGVAVVSDYATALYLCGWGPPVPF